MKRISNYSVLLENLIEKGYDPYIWIINEDNYTKNVEKFNVLFDGEEAKFFIQGQPYLERFAFESKLIMMSKSMNLIQKKLFNKLLNDCEIRATNVKCLKVLNKNQISVVPLNKENDIYSLKELKDDLLIVFQLPFFIEVKVEKDDIILLEIVIKLKRKDKVIQIDNFCKFISN